MLLELAVSIFAAAFLLAIAVSFIRGNWRLFLSSANRDEISAQRAKEWKDAIARDDRKMAIVIADSLNEGEPFVVPPYEYARPVFELGLSTLVLSSPLSKFDFDSWRDAWILRQFLSENILENAGPGESFEKLITSFEIVSSPSEETPPLKLSEILLKKRAGEADFLRVFCRIMQMKSWEPALVVRLDEKGAPLDMLCEIRRNGSVWLFSPSRGIARENMSAADSVYSYESSPFKLPSEVSGAPRSFVYLIPSEFQDYRAPNQDLARKIADPSLCFGIDPLGRMERFKSQKIPGAKDESIFFWKYPFIVLKAQKDFPKDWLRTGAASQN